MINPFTYGGPIAADQFLNRQKLLNRVVNRINTGQSTAIVGEPRTGKTSLLEYLIAPETQASLYGKASNRLAFCLLDTQMLGGQFSQAQFWEQALTPLFEKVVEPNPNTPLAEHYYLCRQNRFGTFMLERFFKQLQKDQWRLVLLLDEFDLLLHDPKLNNAEFFGSLRALTSRSRGALVVVTASRQSLTALNAATQALNPTGSPYFNIFAEMTLGAFPSKDIVELLDRAGSRFVKEDRRYIDSIAGGHPYLLQAAASMMWEAIDEGINQPYLRHLAVGKRLHYETRSHLDDTWRLWSPATRKAITTVALCQMPYLLQNRDFLTDNFVEDLRNFGPEINELKTIGLIIEDHNLTGGHRLAQGVILWWLADELVRTVRDDIPFDKWLKDQEMIGLLTKKEIEWLNTVAKFVGGLLKQGAATLIEAFAKGLVGGK